jgi:hypothetical protein
LLAKVGKMAAKGIVVLIVLGLWGLGLIAVVHFEQVAGRIGLLVVALVGAGLFFWDRWHKLKRRHKQVGDANEFEWLDELVREHEDGTRDHYEKIERLIRTIENGHDPSPKVTACLLNARRAIRKSADA